MVIQIKKHVVFVFMLLFFVNKSLSAFEDIKTDSLLKQKKGGLHIDLFANYGFSKDTLNVKIIMDFYNCDTTNYCFYYFGNSKMPNSDYVIMKNSYLFDINHFNNEQYYGGLDDANTGCCEFNSKIITSNSHFFVERTYKTFYKKNNKKWKKINFYYFYYKESELPPNVAKMTIIYNSDKAEPKQSRVYRKVYLIKRKRNGVVLTKILNEEQNLDKDFKKRVE